MMIYLLKFSSLLILAAIGYTTFLKPLKEYSLSRKYLLSSILASLYIPTIPHYNSKTLDLFSITLPELTIVSYGQLSTNSMNDTSINWLYLISIIYLVLSLVLVLRLIYSIWGLYRLIHSSKVQILADEKCHVSDKVKNPFSFFNYIVLPDNIHYSSIELRAIIQHEKLHVKHHHSLEKIVIEIFKCFFWWHPVSWYYSKELDLIHEFQVDQAMSTKMDIYQYKKILVDLVLYKPGLRFVNPISSNIKKRLQMMNQNNKSNNPIRIIGLCALLITGSLFIHSCQKEETTKEFQAVENNVPEAKTDGSNAYYQYESVDTILTFDYNTQEESIKFVKKESTVYTAPESMPRFPGCDGLNGDELEECSNKKLLQFIYTNITYPEEARKAGKEGTMVVKFIVDKTGQTYGYEFKRTVGPEFESTILQLLDKMNNEITWIPGMHGGKAVDVQYILPVKFKLEG